MSSPEICQHCQMFSSNPHLFCAIHPNGPAADGCLDYAPNARVLAEEQWEVTVPSYYLGQPVPGFGRVLTVEEQWEILNWHPLFTGVCPECGAVFDQANPPEVHWDCSGCGWKDDTV
jgi:hypothetical protein